MLIEDPDSLKGWLVQLLKPLCEADPEALAKYVMALVKKDKPEEELRKSCLEQLEVFLSTNTASFVQTFFAAVHDKSYLNPVTAASVPALTAAATTTSSSSKSSSPSDANNQHNNSNSTTTSLPAGLSAGSDSTLPATTGADGQDESSSDRRSTRRSSRSRSPGRKSGNNSSSNRRNDSDRRDRRYDRKRDHTDSRDGRIRRRSTTRSRSPSPASRIRRNIRSSRSPISGHDKAAAGVGSGRKRSVSPSSPDRTEGHSKSQRKERCRDFDERGFCMRGDQCPFVSSHSDPVVLDAEPFLTHRAPAPPHPPPQQQQQLPPLGTGGPALLPVPSLSSSGGPNSVSLPPVEYDPRNPGMDGHPLPNQRQPPPQMMLMPPPVPHGSGNWNSPNSGPYVPTGRPNLNVINLDAGGHHNDQQNSGLQSTVSVISSSSNNSNNHQHHMNHQSHSLLGHHPHQVPNGAMHNNHHPHHQQQHHNAHQHPQMQHMMHSGPQGMGPMMPSHHMSGRGRGGGGRGFGGRGRGRGGGFIGRGGMMMGMGGMMMRPQDQPERCTLEVRKLPPNLNTIATLNDYFSKYGSIVNLQIKYDGDPEAAVVQFASHGEAVAAHRAPEAVLGNRFIKLFWHNKEQEKADPTPEKPQLSEGTESDDRPSDGSENKSSNATAGDKEDDEEDKNRIPAKDRLELKPLDEGSFKLQLPKQKPSRPVLNPNLLRKSNVEKTGGSGVTAGDVVVPMIKTRSEQKKEKLLKNIELRKMTESLLTSLRKDQGSIADKMIAAKTKEERSSLKRLFDVLDIKRKKVEGDLKRISEELLMECGSKGSGGPRKRPAAVSPAALFSHGVKPAVTAAVEIKKQLLDRELDQISENNRKPPVVDEGADAAPQEQQEPQLDAGEQESAATAGADDVQSADQEPGSESDFSDPLEVQIKLAADS